MKEIDALKRSSFFSELGNEDLNRIVSISKSKSFSKTSVIFTEGEPGDAFYYVKSGKVKIHRSNEDGKELIVHILGEGDIFAEATLFNNGPYPASASAFEDCIVGVIKNKDLENLISLSPKMSLSLIKIMSRKLIFAQQTIRDLTFYDVFSRTAALLLKLSKEHGIEANYGVKIEMELSRQQLAEMVSTTRETISRVISKFKKEGSLLEVDERIIIKNAQKLKEWL